MNPTIATISFRPAGDQALVVELGGNISRATNARVRDLDTGLREAKLKGIVDTVPSYRSLLVYYQPLVIGYADLVSALQSILAQPLPARRTAKRWHLPVLYGAECAADLGALAEKVKMSQEQMIETHSSAGYMVYMVGFSPGFAYLGELPKALEVPRKLMPARSVPANAIQVGGAQTAVSSMPMPSGWYVIGRTPVRMYDLRRAEPFLLSAGDLVKFHPISEAKFCKMAEYARAGELQPCWEWAE